MQKYKKENFLKKRLLFWVVALVVTFCLIYVVEIIYTASATTYTTTANIPEIHKVNIATMKYNHASSMNMILYRYDIVDGKYLIGFALIYNLACLACIVGCAFNALNAYYYFCRIIRNRCDRYIYQCVKHTLAMDKLETTMRYERGRKLCSKVQNTSD